MSGCKHRQAPLSSPTLAGPTSSLMLLLPLLLLLLQQLAPICQLAVSAEDPARSPVSFLSDDNDDVEFFDAEQEPFADMDLDQDDDDDDDDLEDADLGDADLEDAEKFYDAEDEISYDEEAEENVCATSDLWACGTCCRQMEFDLPHWDTTVGQCLCFQGEAEPNVCKTAESTQSRLGCETCCSRNHYGQNIFSAASSTCYCSLPDRRHYPLARG